jgi:hypothetical protein
MRNSLWSIAARLSIFICATMFVTTAVEVSAQASGIPDGPLARAASRINLVEIGRLKLSKEDGSAIFESGRVSGTYAGPMTAAFTIRPKSVAVSFTIDLPDGTIAGTAYANYKIVGPLGYFGGTFSLGRCTGKYRHATAIKGKTLGFSGIINRNTFDVEVKAKGEISL